MLVVVAYGTQLAPILFSHSGHSVFSAGKNMEDEAPASFFPSSINFLSDSRKMSHSPPTGFLLCLIAEDFISSSSLEEKYSGEVDLCQKVRQIGSDCL